MFGFLLLVALLLVVTCAEISIVLTYFQLCAEDYRWWWRSMLVPGASGLYLYAYCIFYYSVNLDITGTVPKMLYFGYMGLVAAAFTLVRRLLGGLCGALGGGPRRPSSAARPQRPRAPTRTRRSRPSSATSRRSHSLSAFTAQSRCGRARIGGSPAASHMSTAPPT